MGASGLDGPGVVVGSIVGLVLVAKKRSRNGRRPNQILQVAFGGALRTHINIIVIPVIIVDTSMCGEEPIENSQSQRNSRTPMVRLR